MYSRMRIIKSTGTYSDNVTKLKQALADTDAVVIGAGAGLSTSAGFVYSGKKYLTKLNGQCLHAYYISFTHPRTNEILAFSAPLPEYFTDFLKSIQ